MSLVSLGEFSLSSSDDDDDEEEPAGDEVGDEEGDDGSCGGSSWYSFTFSELGWAEAMFINVLLENLLN